MAAATYYNQVQEIYVAYYGRPADPAGLQYWAGKLDAVGGNLTTIINAFGNSTESTALYAGASNSAIVTAIYQQLFNRAPDSAGLAFYTGELTAGRMTGASIALNVADGAVSTDATYLANKIIVANAFTDALTVDSSAALAYDGTTAITAARSLITGVTTSAATTNVASTITSIKSGGGSTAGETFTLTTSDDTFVGTTGNDTFNATTKTLSADDRISDASTTDSDTLKIVATADPAVMNVSNVENINIDWQAYSSIDLDLDDVRGADAITVTSSKVGFQGDALVTNAGSNGLVFGAGMVGDITVSGSEDATITANFADTVTVSGGDGTITIVANAASSIAVSGGDEVVITATSADTIDLSGSSMDTISLTVGADVDLDLTNTDAEADVVINSEEDVTVSLAVTSAFGTITAGGTGAIALDVTSGGMASGAEITGFGSLVFSDALGADIDLTNTDAETEIVFESGASGSEIVVNTDAVVTLETNSNGAGVILSTGSGDSSDDTVTINLQASGSSIALNEGGSGGQDFETANINVDVDDDFSGDFAMTLSGGGTYVITSTNADANIFVSGDSTTVDSGGDATQTDSGERTFDFSAVAGSVDFIDLASSGDTTIIGGDGILTVDVTAHSSDGGVISIVTGDGGSEISGGDVNADYILAVVGGAGDDDVTIGDVSGADSGLALVLGNGDNVVTFGGVVDASGSATIQTGTGDDTVVVPETVSTSGGSLSIDLGAGDDTLNFASGAVDWSSGDVSVSNVETIYFGSGASGDTVLASLLDGKSYTLEGIGATGNAAGEDGSGANSAPGQLVVLLASGGEDADFSGLKLDGVTGLDIEVLGSGSFSIVGTAGDDDFSGGNSGAYTIEGGKGTDEIYLDAGVTATLVFAAGDSNATSGTMDYIAADADDISGGDIVFDFNLAAATDDNLLVESGAWADDAAAIAAATAAFAADKALKYYVTDDGIDGWLFVNSKSGSAPEIGIRLIGFADATEFTNDNITG